MPLITVPGFSSSATGTFLRADAINVIQARIRNDNNLIINYWFGNNGKYTKIIIISATGAIPDALIMLIQGFLAGLDVLVQSLADGAGTCVEFLDHSFYTLTKTGLVQIYCKDVLAAVEFLKA